jgi:hypothetical protein
MNKKSLLMIFICFVFATVLSAKVYGATVAVNATGDSFLHGSGHTDENEGAKKYLRFQNGDRFSHILVRFPQTQIQAALNGKFIVSARLEFFIETNNNNWGTGTIIDVHKILADWNELGVTFNCPNDTNLSNTIPNCPVQWNGGTYELTPTNSVLHTNGETGWKSFDVTADIQSFTFGGEVNYGWLLRKRNNSDAGSGDYTSREGTSGNTPRLTLVVEDDPVTPNFGLMEVAPYIIRADNLNKTIILNGSQFDSTMQVFVDGIAVPYTLISSTQAQIILAYDYTGRHFIDVEKNSQVSMWEKGFYSVKTGEVATNISIGKASADSVVFAYSIDPVFDDDTVIYLDTSNPSSAPSGVTGSMILATDNILVSSQEMEFIIPGGISDFNGIFVDTTTSDLYKADSVRKQNSSPLTPNSNLGCKVEDIMTTFDGTFAKFKTVTSGCCRPGCSGGNRYHFQYVVDGIDLATDHCYDIGSPSGYGNWVFPPGNGHTIGARVVEWRIEGSGGNREMVCTNESGVKTKSLGRVNKRSDDADSDSIPTTIESQLINTYDPYLVINALLEIQYLGNYTVPNFLTVRVGPVMVKKAVPEVNILMNYNALYSIDYGCGAFSSHPYDTEPFGYLLSNVLSNASPVKAAGWDRVKTKTVAHDGTAGQKVNTVNGFADAILVGAFKHGNFLFNQNSNWSICNYTDIAGVPVVKPYDNVGNSSSFGGTCAHPEHLTNGNYRVPDKWERMRRHFSTRLHDVFPKQ